MSCESVDLKGYVLEEIPAAERGAIEQHVAGCGDCREELERLRLTGAALMSVADEEIPQRIAFVSDKVFEPKWWQRIWTSGPAMGFAAAAMLAVAILAHGVLQRPVEVAAPEVASIDEAHVQAMVEAEVSRRVDAAVTQAVADAGARQQEETNRLLAAAEKSHQEQMDDFRLAVKESFEVMAKRQNTLQVALNRGGLQ